MMYVQHSFKLEKVPSPLSTFQMDIKHICGREERREKREERREKREERRERVCYSFGIRRKRT
jgi:hypothetical protein